jgi:F-type H+-transporting ATPase subunit gamma
MAVGKEIRGKIKSVENTKKITKAMEMVAASKMRKAQERMRAARPYSDKIRNITANLAQANPEYQSPTCAQRRQGKAVGFIVVTTDKGLCGGLNTNVLRAVTNQAEGVQPRAAHPGGGHRQQGLRLPEPHRRQRVSATPPSWATRRSSTS